MGKSKIRVVLEHEFRRGINTAQTARNMAEVFGDNSLYQSIISRWFAKFRLENEPRGRPEIKVNNDDLKAVGIGSISNYT